MNTTNCNTEAALYVSSQNNTPCPFIEITRISKETTNIEQEKELYREMFESFLNSKYLHQLVSDRAGSFDIQFRFQKK